MTSPVVVGYDGSDQSEEALQFGIEEARRRNRRLRIVHADLAPLQTKPYDPVAYLAARDAERKPADEMIEAVGERIREAAPDLDVEAAVVSSFTVAGSLLEESKHAELMVVGNRGRGGFSGLLLGSVSLQTAMHADCPVVVMRPRGEEPAHPGAVVAAIDGGADSQEVMRFAFETASQRGAPLVAVHAWIYPMVAGPDDMVSMDFDYEKVAADESATLTTAIAGWRDKFPDVAVTERTRQGRTRAVLLAESQGAELLVVGSRGRGGLLGMVLGSTSQAMLHHAQAPVAVVRSTQS